MVVETGKLARWSLRWSEFEFFIVRSARVKHQAAGAVSRLRTRGEDKAILSAEVPFLTNPQEIFACGPRTDITRPEFIEERKGLFVPFSPEVCMMAGIAENEKAEIPKLAKFIPAQSTDADCRSTLASVGKPNMRFNVDRDGVFVRVSTLNCAA